jgi:hypothetical protein
MFPCWLSLSQVSAWCMCYKCFQLYWSLPKTILDSSPSMRRWKLWYGLRVGIVSSLQWLCRGDTLSSMIKITSTNMFPLQFRTYWDIYTVSQWSLCYIQKRLRYVCRSKWIPMLRWILHEWNMSYGNLLYFHEISICAKPPVNIVPAELYYPIRKDIDNFLPILASDFKTVVTLKYYYTSLRWKPFIRSQTWQFLRVHWKLKWVFSL